MQLVPMNELGERLMDKLPLFLALLLLGVLTIRVVWKNRHQLEEQLEDQRRRRSIAMHSRERG